jgi:hypothetical protein
MKNLILVLFVAMSATLFGQNKINYYTSAGLSISNSGDTTFSYSSYPSIEFGGMYDNIGVGLVLGRSNLSGFRSDVISNYWYEIKTSACKTVGSASVYGLFGIGNYLSTKRVFIEYGAGISYTYKSVSFFTQASNWDGYWYVTPGITYNF